MIKKLLNTLIVLFCINITFANQINELYSSAKLHFDNERFETAYIEFSKLKLKLKKSDLGDDVDYYIVKSAIALDMPNAYFQIKDFRLKNPDSRFVNSVQFDLAKYEYNKGKYSKAVKSFLDVKEYKLSEKDKIEYEFMLAYSYLMTEKNDKAITLFYKIKDKDSDYKIPSLYYYSHLEYLNKNYKTALEGFNFVIEDSRFVDIALFYIAKIHYHLGEYEVAIKRAKAILDRGSEIQKKELFRIIGESYLSQKKYSNAITYLLKYKNLAKSLSRSESYNLAFAYYKTNELEASVKYFKDAAKADDEMAQNSYFFIADAYLKLKNYEEARDAFRLAMQMDYDKQIKEDSHFNFAKLSYQLRPLKDMDNEMKPLMDFINEYPNSRKLDEAYSVLIDAFTNTRRYKETLKYIEKLNEKTPSILAVKQNISLNRGIELYNNHNYKLSIKYFKQAFKLQDYNKEIAAKAIFWEGDAYYQLKRYNTSLKKYKSFQVQPGAFGTKEFNMSYYNIAYAYFKLKKYSESIPWFQKFLDNNENNQSELLADAYLRLGDCYFLGKNYSDANRFYKGVQALNTDKKDYAMFQSGITFGLSSAYKAKILQMKSLLTEFPKSAYADDALFELGKTYIILRDSKSAIASYNRLYQDYNYSKFAPKAKLQLGLIYYNKQNYNSALNHYKEVISKYPKTNYSKSALMSIKNIYTDVNKPNEYIAFVEGNEDLEDISVSEKEKLFYDAAERLYAEDKFAEAAEAFSRYNKAFPKGLFVLKSHFFAGESYYEINNFTDALEAYEYVVEIPNNEFLYTAIKKSAIICAKDSVPDKVVKYYGLLEQNSENKKDIFVSRVGLMRAFNDLDKADKAREYAEKVLKLEKVSVKLKIEANKILAQSYEKEKDIDNMMKTYKELTKYIDTQAGAEAKYKIIKFNFDNELYELAEKECFDFAQKNTSQRYWLAKSFIVLSNIYLKQDNAFQAKATLKSILNNYKSTQDSIISDVNSLLKKIAANEKALEKKQKEENRQEFKIKVDKSENGDNAQAETQAQDVEKSKQVKVDSTKNAN
jgi:tetratricopeptide (TPR) repeat protein